MPSYVGYKKNLKVYKLDLSYNKVREVDLKQLYDIKMQIVDLSHNNVEMIYGPTRLARYYIEHIIIHHNPIVCNATLIGFAKALFTPNPTWDVKGLRCAGPWPMRGQLVADIKPTDLLAPLTAANKNPTMKDTVDCPTDCNCWLQRITLMLLVNCSHTGSNRTDVPPLPNPRAYALNSTELRVQHNGVETLPVLGTNDAYAYVIHINASHNRIGAIMTANIPPLLRVIDLRHNRLRTLDSAVIQVISGSAIQRFWIAANPWRCDCTAADMLMYVQSNGSRRHTDYLEDARCADDGRTLADRNVSAHCGTLIQVDFGWRIYWCHKRRITCGVVLEVPDYVACVAARSSVAPMCGSCPR